MPLSDFLWPVQTTAAHNNGVKRKMSGDASCIETEEQAIKRRCTTMSPSGDSDMHEMDDENHNEMSSQNLNNVAFQPSHIVHNGIPQGQAASTHISQGQQQLTCTGFLSQPRIPNSHIQNQAGPGFISQQTPSQQQEPQNLIMNINDEVYTNSCLPTDDEMAHNTMDSDFVPNQQQYNVRVFDTAASEPMATIDHVKCYCRPSWEGVLEMKPYCSDYY